MAKASDEYVKQLLQEVAKSEADKKALVEEFEKAAADTWDPSEIREKFKELLPQAFVALKQLMLNAESESVRAALIKYVFDTSLREVGQGDEEKERETFSKLIAKLTADATKK